MATDLPGFFQGTEMPTAGWWETLWPAPATVLAAVGIIPGMEVIDLCSGDGWFTLSRRAEEELSLRQKRVQVGPRDVTHGCVGIG